MIYQVDTMNLLVCTMAKNEEKIECCLKCLRPYGFEIIVVDAGSTDATKEIASHYTSTIYDLNGAITVSA